MNEMLLRFDQFQLDVETGELRKSGSPVKLPPQPARVLILLARNAGRLVTREDIQREVWRTDTFVDFEQGLNYCLKEIRAALGDDARAPKFIETLPKRGYRFLAPVDRPAASASSTGKIVVVVVPFENLSGDPDQEYFSDGLTDELAGLAQAYAAAGMADAMERILSEILGQTERYVSPYNVARVFAARRDADRVFEWLERAYEEHNPDLIELRTEPVFDSVRGDARFGALLRRIGWRQ